MKKVGILTFHRAINYGAQLQAYALQQAVSGLGAACEVVDYICPVIVKAYQPFQINKKNLPMSIAKSLVMWNRRRKKAQSFESFQQKIVKSNIRYTPEDIHQANKHYDLFISGSDQVFSPCCVDFDPVYFLTFAEAHKKYSYAASFATKEIPQEMVEEYKKRLKDFQSISVRETEGVSLVQQLCQKEAKVHLDPSMLLSKEQWSEIAQVKEEQPYILIYTLWEKPGLMEFARKLAKEKNMKIIALSDAPHLPDSVITYRRATAVEEFLGYFKNASYVITNSFHGTAFAVIFHKSLFVEYENKVSRNIRSESLMKSLGICREIVDGNAAETEICWDEVDKKLNALREESIEYLGNIING